jgi:hypothetical protein
VALVCAMLLRGSIPPACRAGSPSGPTLDSRLVHQYSISRHSDEHQAWIDLVRPRHWVSPLAILACSQSLACNKAAADHVTSCSHSEKLKATARGHITHCKHVPLGRTYKYHFRITQRKAGSNVRQLATPRSHGTCHPFFTSRAGWFG